MAKQSLFQILGDLAIHQKKLVLMQGRDYWRIEDLFAQVKADVKASERARQTLLDPIYTVETVDGKVEIRKAEGGRPVFVEAGSLTL